MKKIKTINAPSYQQECEICDVTQRLNDKPKTLWVCPACRTILLGKAQEALGEQIAKAIGQSAVNEGRFSYDEYEFRNENYTTIARDMELKLSDGLTLNIAYVGVESVGTTDEDPLVQLGLTEVDQYILKRS